MTLRKIKLQAFSLIEIAIALVIMGIIIAGVLKGKDLLESARLKTVITQINQYKLATHAFYDRYGALPGDFDHASEYIQDTLQNGNNNGEIEGLGTRQGPYDHEALSYWAHLIAADMITVSQASPQGLPGLKVGGYVSIRHNPGAGLNGHWFVLGHLDGPANDGGLLTPLQALSLAQKMDSADPFSGSVQVRNGARSTGCLKGKLIHTQNKVPACTLYVRL